MKNNKFKTFLIHALFPQNIKCVVCEKELTQNTHYSLCEHCLKHLPRNNGKTCLRCGEPIYSMANYCLHCKHKTPVFTRCFSPLLYEYPVTKLIKDFKYNNNKFLSKTLGNFLVECYVVNNLSCDLVMPVPLFSSREKKRGFNQALLLSLQLQEKLNLKIVNDVLIRVKNTKTQTLLTKEQREENVSSAFVVADKSKVKNATVLVVDDVYTTGSTLNECAKVLFSAGAKRVYCLTLAHTLVEKAL